MYKIIPLTMILFFNTILSQNDTKMIKSIHDFSVTDIYGKNFDFNNMKGKKIMVVNTASKCGLTPQYKALEKLYKEYKDKNFIVIGFPSNNFLWQEPGTDDQIAEFCKENYGVTFPMMSKISVKGSSMHPIYKFLTDKNRNGVVSSSVSWNFQKYLINEDGSIHKVISPRTKPEDPKIIEWINSI